MGRTVAAKLVEAGVAVQGYDGAPACIEQSRAAGVAMCGSLRELACATDWVMLFLPGPAEIAACVAGADGLLSAQSQGSVIIDLCTSSPENTVAMARAARAAGVHYLDAPVLGRPVTVGKWSLPVGGEPEVLDEVRPLLDLIAANVVHIGESGSGHKVKLLNQLMFGAINGMTAEMMAVAEKVGVPPARLYEVITASQAATVSNLFKELGRRVSEDRYDDPTFTVALLAKDVRLGLEMAESAGAPLLLGRAVDFLNKAASAQGMGAADSAVMWQCVKNLWKA
jgi:3-hydroxyisobutyrate dehydrogenase-like beta-hydroxyacid dehydrogenase